MRRSILEWIRAAWYNPAARIVAAAALVCAALLWFSSGYKSGTGQESRMQMAADVNGNGIEELYVLEAGVLRAFEGGEEIWCTPEECDACCFTVGDIDGDGQLNVAVGVWRRGSFGRHRPFWETGPDNDYKNHLYIYRVKDGALRPMWFSSALARPIVTLEILDGDESAVLVVQEGHYKKGFGGKYSVDEKKECDERAWRWDEWGFSPTDRGEVSGT